MPEIRHIKYVSASDMLFGEVNVLHTRIKLVVDDIRGIGAPDWLNIFFNGPRSIKILNSHDAKIATTLA